MKRREKFLIFIFVSIAALHLFFVYSAKEYARIKNRVQVEENISSTNDLPTWLSLPPSANNISYCRIERFKFTAYEFNSTEEDFLSWFREYPMNKIDRPVQILRYNAYFVPLPKKNDPQSLREYESGRRAKVSSGYEYYHNDGYNPSLHIVYDTDAGRTYFVEN